MGAARTGLGSAVLAGLVLVGLAACASPERTGGRVAYVGGAEPPPGGEVRTEVRTPTAVSALPRSGDGGRGAVDPGGLCAWLDAPTLATLGGHGTGLLLDGGAEVRCRWTGGTELALFQGASDDDASRYFEAWQRDASASGSLRDAIQDIGHANAALAQDHDGSHVAVWGAATVLVVSAGAAPSEVVDVARRLWDQHGPDA